MSEALKRMTEVVANDLAGSEPVDPTAWAQPFVWREPAEIPRRQWLYKPHLICGFISLTVSPGGVGKSTLALCEALALASGRPLLGTLPTERTRVWVWNGEDPLDEIERRVHAAMIHHGLTAADVEGWLFIGSGRDADLVVAEQDRSGVTVAAPVLSALVDFINENQIGAVVIDPFVSCHRVPENDNGAMDRVAKAWGKVASATGCAIDLVHHTRKTGDAEVSVEDGRGAVALLAAARHARTLKAMSKEEADALGVERADRHSYVRVLSGKANLSRLDTTATWFRLASVHLPNGDCVQAASPWTPPDPFEGVTANDLLLVQQRISQGRGDNREGWRANVQTGEAWVGYAIGEVLKLDPMRPHDKARIGKLLRMWLGSGALVSVEHKLNVKGKTAPFVEVGRWAEL
jgi:hypothetical protein